MGLGLDAIHLALDPREAVDEASGIFIGGGNTFRLLKALYDHDLVDGIRRRVEAGTPYLGTSAGTNVACVSIKTTNDMPIVYPPTFEALGLVPFQINPHYLDPDPASKHQGETREQRIREFHEMNETPVLGLREPAFLRIDDGRGDLLGKAGARLFRKGRAPVELATGHRLDDLLG
jgi:dipeptidase E